MLDDRGNSGAGLGNIAFDSLHEQLFVSDLETGLVHRFDLDGNDLGQFDHGMEGRPVKELEAVSFDPATGVDIESADFDPMDPDTWNLAASQRRVWGLAVHGERLYYAVGEGPQVWSVGIDAQTGAFAGDPR